MWFFNYIIEPIVTTFILSYCLPELSLITRLFTQESICTSSRFLLNHLSLPIKNTDNPTLPKYTFMAAVSAIYYLIYILSWNEFPMIYLYYLFSIICSPSILEFILNHNMWLFEHLRLLQKRTTNYITCIAMANAINHICKENLRSDPKLSYHELVNMVNMQNLNYVWTFLKILVITTIIKYFSRTNYYSAKFLRYLYEMGSIIEVPKYHRSMILNEQTLHPRRTLSKIVAKRKWHYFYDPTVLNLIIQIYREQEGNLLQEVINRFKLQTFQFFTVWCLSPIVPIPISAFLFRFRESYPQNLLVPAINLIFYLFYPQKVLLLSLFTAYAYYLDNEGIKYLGQSLLLLIPNLLHILFHDQRYLLYLISSIPIVYTLTHSPLPYSPYYYLLPLTWITKYNFIYVWLIGFGYFSAYTLSHLMTLAFMLYIMINVASYRDIPPPEVNLRIIESYCARTMDRLAFKRVSNH